MVKRKKPTNTVHHCQFVSIERDAVVEHYAGQGARSAVKKWLVRQVILEESNPRSKSYIWSQKLIFDAKKKQLEFNTRLFRLHPFCRFRIGWELLYLFPAVWTLFIFPIHWTLQFYPNWMADPAQNRKINTIYSLAADTFALIDILLSCVTGAIRNVNDMQYELKNIMWCYLTGSLIPDIVSTIPFYLLLTRFTEVEETYIALANLVLILKILRIIKYTVYLQNTLEVLKFSQITVKKLVVISTLMITCVWMTALSMLIMVFYTTGYKYFFETFQHFLQSKGENKYVPQRKAKMIAATGYKMIGFILGACPFKSCYVANTLKFISYQYVTKIVMRLLSKIGITALTCYIVMVYRRSKTPEMRYNYLIYNVEQYSKRMTPRLQRKLLDFFRFKFRERFIGDMDELPRMKNNKAFEVLLNTPILNELPRSVLIDIADNLKQEIYMPGDIIIARGEEYPFIFFIYSGSAATYTYNGYEYDHYADGDCFGFHWLTRKMPKNELSERMIVAIEMCEMYLLPIEIVLKLIKSYPYIHQRILNYVEESNTLRILNSEKYKSYVSEKKQFNDWT